MGSCLFPWFILKPSTGDKGVLVQEVLLTTSYKILGKPNQCLNSKTLDLKGFILSSI